MKEQAEHKAGGCEGKDLPHYFSNFDKVNKKIVLKQKINSKALFEKKLRKLQERFVFDPLTKTYFLPLSSLCFQNKLSWSCITSIYTNLSYT